MFTITITHATLNEAPVTYYTDDFNTFMVNADGIFEDTDFDYVAYDDENVTIISEDDEFFEEFEDFEKRMNEELASHRERVALCA